MAGIYIHIPFCRRACTYCNFHFSTSMLQKDKMMDAILKEIEMQKDYLQGQTVETIYFGGGTPSLLDIAEVEKILSAIYSNYTTAPSEITLELNPDDSTREKLNQLRSVGVNRLSVGVQSFFDDDLKWMNRSHTSKQAGSCIEDAHDAGFENISADLIYGIPNQPQKNWISNIDKMTAYAIPHLSCYALTVEPKTELHALIEKKLIAPLDEVQAGENFSILTSSLQEKGYEHYEISNFAREKKYALHNTAYWQGKWYLGIGPSAHSYNGVSRQWNVSNNAQYIKSLQENTLAFEKEILTETERANEFIMISLRTMWGLDLNEFRHIVSAAEMESFMRAADEQILQGHMEIIDEHLKIKAGSKFFADGLISELFL